MMAEERHLYAMELQGEASHSFHRTCLIRTTPIQSYILIVITNITSVLNKKLKRTVLIQKRNFTIYNYNIHYYSKVWGQ